MKFFKLILQIMVVAVILLSPSQQVFAAPTESCSTQNASQQVREGDQLYDCHCFGNPPSCSWRPIQTPEEHTQDVAQNTQSIDGESLPGWIAQKVMNGIYYIGIALLLLAGAIFSFAGVLLNYAINLTVIGMTDFVKNTDGINIAWKAVRDLANIVFIFILIYIAIRTILGISDGDIKKLVAKVIFVALIINFSLFFTKVVIDASNIVALQFYSAIVDGAFDEEAGLSLKLMQAIKLTTIYANEPQNLEQFGGVGGTSIEAASSLGATGVGIIAVFLSVIVVLIAAAIFFYAAALFIARFAILAFLMATSPYAFISMILPKASADWWWKYLVRYTLFAPIFLILMWVAFVIIESPAFGTLGGKYVQGPDATFIGAFTTGTPLSMIVLLNYGIILAFMIYALKQAQEVGGTTADWITKTAGTAAFGGLGFAGRQTFGRLASKVASMEKVKDLLASRKANRFLNLGNTALKGIKGVAGGSMDLRALPGAIPGLAVATGKLGIDVGKAGGTGGYQAYFEKQKKARTEYCQWLGYNRDKVLAQENIIKNAEDEKGRLTREMKEADPSLTDAKIGEDPRIKALAAKIKQGKFDKIAAEQERLRGYAATLRDSSIQTLYLETARKDKVIAAEQENLLLEHEIVDLEKDLTETKRKIELLERKANDKKLDSLLIEEEGVITRLTPNEYKEYKSLLKKRQNEELGPDGNIDPVKLGLENKIRNKKLQIATNKTVE